MNTGWQDTWIAFARGPADDDEELNFEQLVALNARAKGGRTPYADFAVFLPFARKVVRTHKFTAYVPQPDGGWLKKEILGPDGYEAWLVSWRVYRVAFIMLNLADEVALTRYSRQIERLAKDWPTAWHLVYLADDKLRAEHFEKIRRNIVLSIKDGARPPLLWAEERPWSSAFLTAAGGSEPYWDRNARHIASRWLAQGGRAAPLTVEEEGLKRGAAAGVHRVHNASGEADDVDRDSLRPTNSARRRAKQVIRLTRPQITEDATPVKTDDAKGLGKGKYTTDQEGKPLCFAWNDGGGVCGALPPGVACPGGRVRKCQFCRSPAQGVACPGGRVRKDHK